MSKRAFTLIELMIVVAIIGILAAIAIPNFVKFQCRSKQSEAKGNLKALYVSQESYRAEADTYGLTTLIVGFAPKGNKIRYVYTTGTNTNTFSGLATVNASFLGELGADNWTVNETNTIANNTNGCN